MLQYPTLTVAFECLRQHSAVLSRGRFECFLRTESQTATCCRVINESTAVRSCIDAAVHCWLPDRTSCTVEDAQCDSDWRSAGGMVPS